MERYFPKKLQKNELFIVEDSYKAHIKVYYRGDTQTIYLDVMNYYTWTPKQAFEDWCWQHPVDLSLHRTDVKQSIDVRIPINMINKSNHRRRAPFGNKRDD